MSCFHSILDSLGIDLILYYIKSYNLLSWTLFYSKDDSYRELSYNILCKANSYTFRTLSLLSLLLNMCLCIDLILSIRNPFYPSKRRLPSYLAYSTIGALVIGLFTSEIFFDEYDKNSPSAILIMLLSVYIMVAMYSFAYAERRLNRPGIERKVRKHFICKHYSYVMIFIAVWAIELLNPFW